MSHLPAWIFTHCSHSLPHPLLLADTQMRLWPCLDHDLQKKPMSRVLKPLHCRLPWLEQASFTPATAIANLSFPAFTGREKSSNTVPAVLQSNSQQELEPPLPQTPQCPGEPET